LYPVHNAGALAEYRIQMGAVWSLIDTLMWQKVGRPLLSRWLIGPKTGGISLALAMVDLFCDANFWCCGHKYE